MILKVKQPTPSMSDLSKIAIGYIVSQLKPRGKDRIEHLRNGLPYAQAVLDCMHNKTPDQARIQELRTSVEAMACLPEAAWDDVPLEELVILAAAEMHNTWRVLYDPKRRDPQWFMCLPLAFIGWERTRKYCEALAPIMDCLGVEDLDMYMLQQAYYEHAANELYKFNLGQACNLSDAMCHMACISIDITRLTLKERELLSNPRFVSEKLHQQLATHGVGNFRQMKSLANTFGCLVESHERWFVDNALMNEVALS